MGESYTYRQYLTRTEATLLYLKGWELSQMSQGELNDVMDRLATIQPNSLLDTEGIAHIFTVLGKTTPYIARHGRKEM